MQYDPWVGRGWRRIPWISAYYDPTMLFNKVAI
jgi:hypothetical protein